jgi:hypothetical protein
MSGETTSVSPAEARRAVGTRWIFRAGRHHREDVPAVEHCPDDVLLADAEGRVGKDAAECVGEGGRGHGPCIA